MNPASSIDTLAATGACTGLAEPFAAGLEVGELRYQQCSQCGYVQTLARYGCQQCGATALRWHASTLRGTVFAATVIERAPSEEFRALVPYSLVLVDMDEGFRVMGHAVAGLAPGTPVVASFFVIGARRLLRFHAELADA